MNNKNISNPKEYFERIKGFLFHSDSDELILLKGHLLIEEIIDWPLEESIGKENYGKLNLNFYRKVILLSGLLGYPIEDELIQRILKINQLRNKFAHDLGTKLKGDLTRLIKETSDDEVPKTINRKSTYLNSLRRTFSFILGEIHGVSSAFIAIKLKYN